MHDIEELEDIKAYDKAKSAKDIAIPFEQAIQEIRRNEVWNKNFKESSEKFIKDFRTISN